MARILDLFSGAGGAAAGYARAGHTVLGIDNNPELESDYRKSGAHGFKAMDWREAVETITDVDAYHASPPCQHDSIMTQCRHGVAATYPDLLNPVREALIATGRPYVIEQPDSGRMRAKMRSPVMLCGTAFGLTVSIGASTWELRRHRLFESSVPLSGTACNHKLRAFPLYGHGYPGNRREEFRGLDFAEAARQVMGITWTTNRPGLTEAIPPAFTRNLGEQITAYFRTRELAQE
jgi:DNA (cytosine-5)-methyltransferase 1